MILETHAHYDDEKFDADRVELLSHLWENNIYAAVNMGASFRGCKDSLSLSHLYDKMYAGLGIHPEEYEDFNEENYLWIKENAKDPKVVCIGEIGLDYYWVKEPELRKLQREWFLRQLKLAKELDLPVNIHSRDAAEDTLEIMKEAHKMGVNGIIHCFSYSKEIAHEYVKMGYYIGIGGVVTFKNSKKLVETVASIPLENIVLETDSPYMAPTPHRGERNSSLFLPYVVEKIAQIKDVDLKTVEDITLNNALNLYTKINRRFE